MGVRRRTFFLNHELVRERQTRDKRSSCYAVLSCAVWGTVGCVWPGWVGVVWVGLGRVQKVHTEGHNRYRTAIDYLQSCS